MNKIKNDLIISNINIKYINEFLSFFLKITPLFLFIGIFYQFIILIKIDKLIFYSWSQVINDTVSIFFPLLFGFFGLIIGLQIKIDDKKGFSINFLLSPIIAFILSLVILSFNINILFYIYITGYLSVYIWKTFIAIQIFTGSEKLKNKNHRFGLSLIFSIISIILIFQILIINQFNNIYIELNNNKEKIIYMNDKYIILENKVISNTSDIIFYYK